MFATLRHSYCRGAMSAAFSNYTAITALVVDPTVSSAAGCSLAMLVVTVFTVLRAWVRITAPSRIRTEPE